jgi:5-methylcytosine-specific restriction endonuclease McrA
MSTRKRSQTTKKSLKTSSTDWTDGRLKSFITSVLRGGYRRYPAKYEVLKEASVGKKLNKTTKRMAEHFICNHCKKEYPGKEVNVDHIVPVTCPVEGFIDWDVYIKRMFCDKSNLQVLCKKCHDNKTASERGVRNETKKTKV